MKKEINYDMFS